MGLINKLINLTRFGVLKTAQQDKTTNNKTFYNAQGISYGGLNEYQIIYPMGIYAVAPQGAQFIGLNVGAQAENKVAFAFDIATQFSGLKPYELQCGNQQIKSYINFLNDGSINILTPKGNMNVTTKQGNVTINITGNYSSTVTGTTTITAQNTYTIHSTNNITIESDTQLQLKVGGATLTLTATSLVSSVPIIAPAVSISGGGAMTMDGGSMTGMSDMVTQAGKSFNAHTHSPGSFEAGGDPVTGTSGTLT